MHVKRFVMVLPALFLTGCVLSAKVNGHDVAKTDIGGGEHTDLQYKMCSSGCSTGRHHFSSYSALCKALGEEDFNRGCAYAMRREMFDSDCHGYTWDSSNTSTSAPQSVSDLNCDDISHGISQNTPSTPATPSFDDPSVGQ